MASIRCFIAIELPEEVKEALASAVDALRPEVSGMRWTRSESLHLTLKFLGDVYEAGVPAVEDAIGTIVFPPPLALGLYELGGFPSQD